MRKLLIIGIITVVPLVAAACGGAAANNNNSSATANSAAINSTSPNVGGNRQGRHEDMPMMNANHQTMGDQHRTEGMRMEDRQMRPGQPNSADQNSNK